MNEDATAAGYFAAARAAAMVGDAWRARAICASLYQRLSASEPDFIGFVGALLREGLTETAAAMVRDSTLGLRQAGAAEAHEALLSTAISWFADDPWFATEYASVASDRGDWEEAAYRWHAVRSRWPERAPSCLKVSAQNEQAFASAVADLEVDEAAHRREMIEARPPDRNYIIVFTPRSGSSWLVSMLGATQLLGQPGEFINPGRIRDLAIGMNSKDPSGALALLKRRRKSANGVFGLKVTAIDVVLFGEAEFFGAFDPTTVIFNLWRDNVVAQGISLYRAVSTGRFHSWDAADPVPLLPVYDPGQIRRWVQHVANYENQNLLMLDRHGYAPRALRYEDIARSRATTISIFADAMRVNLPAGAFAVPKPEEPHKIGDGWNRATELRFRDEDAEFVRHIEGRRLIKREP